jgi:6-phosphogluconolactonase
MWERSRNWPRLSGACVMVLAGMLTGCSGFFVPENGTGGGSGGGTGTGTNFVYVGNAQTNTISGFQIGTGVLTNVPNMPYDLGFSPAAMVMHPTNKFLYVAGVSSIFMYSVGTDGSLSAAAVGAGVAVATVNSIDISPDGNWLFALDLTQQIVNEYQINQTTGALTAMQPTPYTIAAGVWSPKAVRVAPSGGYVFLALGTGGDVVMTLNINTGALQQTQQLGLSSTQTSDNALAIDSNTAYLYVARTGVNGGLAVYTIGANGVLNAVTGSPFAAGAQPFSVVLDSSGKYVYVANGSDATISGYLIGTGGVLTALSGSPYPSGAQVEALGRDNSGKYLLAAAFGGSPDLTMYSFDVASPGKLDTVTSAITGTDPANAIAIALTH